MSERESGSWWGMTSSERIVNARSWGLCFDLQVDTRLTRTKGSCRNRPLPVARKDSRISEKRMTRTSEIERRVLEYNISSWSAHGPQTYRSSTTADKPPATCFRPASASPRFPNDLLLRLLVRPIKVLTGLSESFFHPRVPQRRPQPIPELYPIPKVQRTEERAA